MGSIGNVISNVPWSSARVTLEARVLDDSQHPCVVGHHLGDEALDPDRRRTLRQLLEHPRADAAPLVVVGDRERRLRDLGSRSRA